MEKMMKGFLFILSLTFFNAIPTTNSRSRPSRLSQQTNSCFAQNADAKFNFNNLTSESKDYRKQYKNGYLRIQLCEPLREACNGGSTGYSVCLIKGDEEIGIGKYPPEIKHEGGLVKYTYFGSKCNSEKDYTVEISMVCDYKANNKEGRNIELLYRDQNDCNIKMNWRTNMACTERKQIDCSIIDTTHIYDLNSLKRFSNNYEIAVNDTISIVLNVCHSIIYGPNACSSSNSACLSIKNLDGSKRSTGLGMLKEGPLFNSSDNTLTLTYVDGYVCPIRPEIRIRTILRFVCDIDAEETMPQYEGGMEDCLYRLLWRTSAACSTEALQKKSLEEKKNYGSVKSVKASGINDDLALFENQIDFRVKPVDNSRCSKVDLENSEEQYEEDHKIILNNFNYDTLISPLISKFGDLGFVRVNSLKYPKKVYSINLCGDKIICNGAFACDKETSYGVKKNVRYNISEGTVRFNFTGGSQCKHTDLSAQSSLTIICDEENSSSVPFILHEESCKVDFAWYTTHICVLLPKDEFPTSLDRPMTLTSGAAYFYELFRPLLLVFITLYLQK